jgi:archaellum component FlaG (FlaF/FlaG flagellin family)
MTSSDRGNVTLNNLVKFRKDGYYRIYVRDTDGNESYIQFSVGDTDSGSSYSDGDLKVSASPSNPDTYEWVKLTIETDDDYTGKINFPKVQYRSSSSDSWTTLSYNTSSTYVSDYSSDWSNGYYRMTSSDDGYVTLKNLVKFKKSGYYRIYVEDTDGNESYVQINVDVSSSSSSSSNSDKVKLSTNRKSPSTSQYVNLTIETDSTRYTGKLTFSAKYRSSSSDSWSSISRTSSSYFSDYSNEWDNGYYKMTSSDKGEVTIKDIVKFKKNGYYRIYVEDTSGNESYIQFTVGNVNNDDDDESNVS